MLLQASSSFATFQASTALTGQHLCIHRVGPACTHRGEASISRRIHPLSPLCAHRRLRPTRLLSSPSASPPYAGFHMQPLHPHHQPMPKLRSRPVKRPLHICRHSVEGSSGHSHTHHDHKHSHDPHTHSSCNGHTHHTHAHSHDHSQPTAPTSNNAIIAAWQNLQRATSRLSSYTHELEHNPRVLQISAACFAAALLVKVNAIASLMPVAAATWAHKVLLLGTFLLSGLPQMAETAAAVVHGTIDTHVLMTLAILGTIYVNMAAEGALLLLLFRVSHALEDRFVSRAHSSLSELLSSLPTMAAVVQLGEGGEPLSACMRQVPASSVTLQQHILVKPGEQVPLDGEVVWGVANVTMAHITGEVHPVRITPGREVAAGSLSTDGTLVLRVTALSKDSTPRRIAQMAMDAKASKPLLQRRIDSIGSIWSKAIIALTALVCAALLYTGTPFTGPNGALYRALGVLTACSPCALVLVPLGYVCAMATITRRGVLVKAAGALDALAACRTVALDKTGTITSGTLTFTSAYTFTATPEPTFTPFSTPLPGTPLTTPISPRPGGSELGSEFESRALSLAVELSRLSTHPVNKALVAAAAATGGISTEAVSISDFQQVPGSGVMATCQLPGTPPLRVRLGSLAFVGEALPPSRSPAAAVPALQAAQGGGTAAKALAFLAVEGEVAAFCFEDAVREGTKEAVEALTGARWKGRGAAVSQEDKMRVLMLTGDNVVIAQQVAGLTGIREVRAALRPEDKREVVEGMRKTALGGVVMVGDGINDAPAISAASVGVAVSSSPTEMAAVTADIIIVNAQGVAALPWLFNMAHRTQSIINQNLVLTFLAMASAAIPAAAGLVPLWLAVLLHEGSTLLVALNSLRLLIDPHPHPQPNSPPHPHSHANDLNGHSRNGRAVTAATMGAPGSGSKSPDTDPNADPTVDPKEVGSGPWSPSVQLSGIKAWFRDMDEVVASLGSSTGHHHHDHGHDHDHSHAHDHDHSHDRHVHAHGSHDSHSHSNGAHTHHSHHHDHDHADHEHEVTSSIHSHSDDHSHDHGHGHEHDNEHEHEHKHSHDSSDPHGCQHLTERNGVTETPVAAAAATAAGPRSAQA